MTALVLKAIGTVGGSLGCERTWSWPVMLTVDAPGADDTGDDLFAERHSGGRSGSGGKVRRGASANQ
jgi:hypothetical protein